MKNSTCQCGQCRRGFENPEKTELELELQSKKQSEKIDLIVDGLIFIIMLSIVNYFVSRIIVFEMKNNTESTAKKSIVDLFKMLSFGGYFVYTFTYGMIFNLPIVLVFLFGRSINANPTWSIRTLRPNP